MGIFQSSSKVDSQIYTSTTRKYALALSLIAGLSLTAYLVMHEIIFEQTHQAALINRSGRQRMLSQRMALLSEILITDSKNTEAPTELREAVQKFSESHQVLAQEAIASAKAMPEMQEVYFGEASHLDRDVKHYQSLFQALLASSTPASSRSQIAAEIREQALHQILPKLDRVVSIQQTYSELQVSHLRELETAILFFTILLLVVEAFFIFRPMATSISRLLREAREAQEAAVLATNQKSAFLATITHEIRTPLVGVAGILEHLIQDEGSTERLQQLRTLRNLSENLVSLVNDILDYSKIEAGKLSFEMVEFDVAEAIGDTEKLFRSSAQAKNISLSTAISAEVPPVLRCDPVRIRQVLTNFVGNALKFTPIGGKISILLKQGGQEVAERRFSLRVEVTDTGVGLSPEAQQRLFQRYSQADNTVSRKYGGTGLGLSICKQIVEQAGGAIGVTSEEGKGSSFWFEIPMDVADICLLPLVENVLSTRRLEGKKILLAEDDNVNREILLRQLHKLGATTYAARDGQEALGALEKNRFDLVLMDCEMPGMDGFTATRRLREMETERGLPRSIVVALTSHSSEDAKDKCLQAGMDSFLTKPVKSSVLSDALMAILQDR